jgi:hypothetical protein
MHPPIPKVWKGNTNIPTSSPYQDFPGIAGVIFYIRVNVIYLSSYPLPYVVAICPQL